MGEWGGARAGIPSGGRGEEPRRRRCVVNSSRPAESKKDDCGRYWRVLQSRLFIYAPKIALLLDMQKTLLKKMGKKMKKLPEFLSKLRESEKVETMGRTARRRQGVFFGRLGVPERSGAGAAGSRRCAVGCFSERAAAGRWAGPAVRGRCGAGAGAESCRGVCFSVGGGAEHGRGGAGARGERRRGQRGWDGCAGISRSPSRFRESPRRDRVRGRRGRARRRSGG